LNTAFDNNGNKRKNSLPLEYRYILGMSGEMDSIGESTDVLTFPDKIAQEIYHLLDGTYYTIINCLKIIYYFFSVWCISTNIFDIFYYLFTLINKF
jgi:hypothetical protein